MGAVQAEDAGYHWREAAANETDGWTSKRG